MIVVTGTAGFIGSCLVQALIEMGYGELLVVVDDFSKEYKARNFKSKSVLKQVDRADFINWLGLNGFEVEYCIHLGAKTDTAEQDIQLFNDLNLNYSKDIFRLCTQFGIPLIYASSAATYGDGAHGYDDDHAKIAALQPLNPYGWSKQNFDIWALEQTEVPPFWAGLKFFNVYGPNEYHKGRMASVIFHTFNQIKKEGKMKLFRSHKDGIADGMQMRDFIYVKDLIEMILFLIKKSGNLSSSINGIYNIGTGEARSFLDLATGVFNALEIPIDISFIDIPEDIRENYQYFTEANMSKLQSIGYKAKAFTLEDGINDYVHRYLVENAYI